MTIPIFHSDVNMNTIPQKQCFKCLSVKPLSCFYKHPQMADGHLNKCKECNRKDVQQNYAKRREQYAKYEFKRNQSAERRAKKREYEKRHRERHPDKAKARNALSNAVRDGRLIRLPCKHCGEVKTEAHHTDYSKPLDVEWLCFKCHRVHGHGQVVISDTQTKTTEGPSHGG
jgi:hypothetical protein